MSVTGLNVTQRTFSHYVCWRPTLTVILAPKALNFCEFLLFHVRGLLAARTDFVEAQFAQEDFLVNGSGAVVERVRQADVVTEFG